MQASRNDIESPAAHTDAGGIAIPQFWIDYIADEFETLSLDPSFVDNAFVNVSMIEDVLVAAPP